MNSPKINLLLLILKNNLHHKNHDALLNYKDFNVLISNNMNMIEYFNYIYCPDAVFDVKNYPNKRFIFGPHLSIFPDPEELKLIQNKNAVYIQPSEWAKDCWLKRLNWLNIEVCPFGVDIDKFKPDNEEDKTEVFIYFKSRKPEELNFIENILRKLNIRYSVFSYLNRYNENDYLNCLKKSKFGIILGRHESQGFAIEEALSMNIPLFVWSAKCMSQEYGSNYDAFECTTVPYWDEKCGEVVKEDYEFEEGLMRFIQNVEDRRYKPREYITENLSRDKCSEIMKNIFHSL